VFTPAVIAIMLRALLPIVKNTYIGLSSIDPQLIDYAKGIGLTDWQINRHIRLPNASPPMFAGIKFAAILANSIAVLTAIIRSGGWAHWSLKDLSVLVRKGFWQVHCRLLGLPCFWICHLRCWRRG